MNSSLIGRPKKKNEVVGFPCHHKYRDFYAIISVSNRLDLVLVCLGVELQELCQHWWVTLSLQQRVAKVSIARVVKANRIGSWCCRVVQDLM